MFDFTKRGPLMMPAGAGAGAGGGAGAGEAAAAFDAEAFTAKLMGEFDKRVNALDKKLTALDKKVKAAPDPNPDPNSNPNPDPDPNPNPKVTDPAVNAELQLLRKQIQTITTDSKKFQEERDSEKKARLETERVTSIRNILNGIEFRDQESRDLVFNAVKDGIKRDENGALIADSDTGPISFDAHIKTYAEKFPYLLQPKSAGGAGASAGTKLSGGKSFDQMSVNELAALKPEEKAALYAGLKDQFGAELSRS